MVLGISGACRTIELVKLTIENVEEVEEVPNTYKVTLLNTKNDTDREFTVGGEFYQIVRKYRNLRPPNTPTNRFFLRYENGKCHRQVIGKSVFSASPRKVAEFLKLPNAHRYTGIITLL